MKEMNHWPGDLGPMGIDPEVSLIELIDEGRCRYWLRIMEATHSVRLSRVARRYAEDLTVDYGELLGVVTVSRPGSSQPDSRLARSDWRLVTLGVMDSVAAQRAADLVVEWGFRADVVAPNEGLIYSEDRWAARQRLRLLNATIRLGSLSAADIAMARSDRAAVRSWLRRTWWPQLRYEVAMRLRSAFPSWAARIELLHNPAPEVVSSWFDASAVERESAWRVVASALGSGDVTRLERVVAGWDSGRSIIVDDPSERYVTLSSASRCAYEIRIAVAARAIFRRGGSLFMAADRLEESARLWWESTAQGADVEVTLNQGEVIENKWVIEVEDMTASEAIHVAGLINAGECGWAHAIDPSKWWFQSEDRDAVRSRLRIIRAVMASGRISTQDQIVAKCDISRYRKWLRGRRSWRKC